MRQTRLTFMTSRMLMENGGSTFIEDKDFTEALDAENEQMSFDFIIDSFEKNLSNFKSRETYVDQLANMP